MADNKNQHFVPRCHLRPFSRDDGGKVINLVNLDLGRAIPGAPVKGQCSGDYFYGEDLRLERRLQQFEGEHATLLATLREPEYRLTLADRATLGRFWLLQHLRTESASMRIVEMMDQLDEDVGGLPEDYRINIKEAVQNALAVFFDQQDLLGDLHLCLVRNGTPFPFVTSDNPAVMANRWHQTDRRTKGVSPGLQNAGMIGLLPLAPRILCLMYDGGLHTVPHVGGWVDASEQDVEACNEQQVLNCNVNLYFQDWDDRDYVTGLADRYRGGRLAARHRIHHMVLESEENGIQTYKRVSAAEARKHQRGMVHHESLTPTPSHWPRLLRWRAGGAVYNSGTGEGFIRRAHRDPEREYRKIRVRD